MSKNISNHDSSCFADSDLPNEVFRDYDIRGFADSQINTQFASQLGQAVASLFRERGHLSIYLGRDCRLSSPKLAQALRDGLLQQGIDVIDLGVTTTPMVNFAVHRGTKASCGVMVTASHNPSDYNGFKIVVRNEVIAGETLQQIKALMVSNLPANGRVGQVLTQEIAPLYIQEIIENTTLSKPFKIVIDAGNAVAGPFAVNLFERLGCQLVPIHCDPDGAFPNHDPNPSDKRNLQSLIDTVNSTQADIGLAFDGDGDRLIVISGNGKIVWPDQLMMLFARDILHRDKNATVVFDVKSSNHLAQLVSKHAGNPIMCKTGHAHVRRAVKENKALLGGEFSGHIFFNDRWYGFDDGLYAAVRLLEILCASNNHGECCLLEQINSELKDCAYTPELLIPISDSEKFSLMETLAANCKFNGAKIITIDGLRVEYPQGWGLIRASNTSANLTMRFEANNEKELQRIKKLFSYALSPFINHVEQYL
jgi:phosphomannomutase/phosphoglucomutase